MVGEGRGGKQRNGREVDGGGGGNERGGERRKEKWRGKELS